MERAVTFRTTTDDRAELLDELAREGVVFFDDLSSASMVRLSEQLGDVLVQDDTDAQGIKLVDADAAMAGSALHTDRSNMQTPPWLVMIGCLTQSEEGGASLFCDGAQLARRLQIESPDVWRALSRKSSACFGRPGYQSNAAIFDCVTPTQCAVRFRMDPWGFYSPQVWAHMPTLMSLINACSWSVQLASGQGYLVHNGRWLHGAEAGRGGHRTVVRTMIVPAPGVVEPFFFVEEL